MKKIPYLRPMKPRESFNTNTTNIVRISEWKSRVSLLVVLLYSEFGWKGVNLLIKEFNFQIFLCIWCTFIWMFNTKSYKLFIYFVLVEYLGEEFIDIYKKYFV